MEIFKCDEAETGWPLQSFRDAYANVAGENICNCFIVMDGDEGYDPDKTAAIFVRTFIENGERAKKDQKYFVGLRFYGYGDMATIDIISLDKDNHREIVKEHAKRMHWILPGAEQIKDAVSQSYSFPIYAIGAHLRVTPEGNIFTFGDSGDFGSNLQGFNVNDVVRQVTFLMDMHKAGSVQGELFLGEILDFMLENKQSSDFYERFVGHFSKGRPTGQNFGGLLTMKVLDRFAQEEGKNLQQLLVEELTDGFAKRCLLLGAARKSEMMQE